MPWKMAAEAWPVLSVLIKSSKRTFAVLLHDPNLWKLIVCALIEISYNFLYEDVGLSEKDKKEIGKFECFLMKLASPGGGKMVRTLKRKRDLIF